jgi:hypothetical protein
MVIASATKPFCLGPFGPDLKSEGLKSEGAINPQINMR